MHRNNVFSEQVLVEGDALVRQYPGEETLTNIMALSEKRSRREDLEASKHCLLKYLKILSKEIYICFKYNSK
jgi:hypothetical protein